MSIIVWALFGLINGLIIHHITKKKNKNYMVSGFLGMTGAVVGGSFALLLFKGLSFGLNNTLSVIFLLEMALLLFFISRQRFSLK